MATAVKKTFLTARVFEGIGRYGDNALAVAQEALVKYWQEVGLLFRFIYYYYVVLFMGGFLIFYY